MKPEEIEFKLIPEQDCRRQSEEADGIYEGRSSISQILVSISEHDLFQMGAKDPLLLGRAEIEQLLSFHSVPGTVWTPSVYIVLLDLVR